jgi:hypothetical protein
VCFEEVAGAPDGGRVGAGDPQVVQAEPLRDPCLAAGAGCCQAGEAHQDDQAVASTADVRHRRKIDSRHSGGFCDVDQLGQAVAYRDGLVWARSGPGQGRGRMVTPTNDPYGQANCPGRVLDGTERPFR